MEKLACTVFMVVLAAALVQVAVAQTVHVVGGNMGWDVPPGGATAYTTWASSRRFVVGDILTFNFQTNSHDVQRVTKESFDACTSSNPIGDLIVTGPANVTLTTAGDHYYICTIGRHCLAGQKLSITVTGGGSPSSPTGSPQPQPPPTGAPTTPAAKSPDNCPPPSAAQPSGSTGGPINDPRSSSSAIVASSLISMLSIVMGLIF